MKRIEFIKKAGLGLVGGSFVALACSNETVEAETTSSTGTSSSGSTNTTCTSTASETAGPFPTKDPASLVLKDITSDRTGTLLTININILNKNTNCAALVGALVDIWHCDSSGYYSEYGGTGMQAANFTSVHFLRGRQTSNASGLAAFKSIYPGWYSGRAPHIHVHVYNASGKSLLVTQIAFPEDISKIVYAQGVYKTHGQADTSNSSDNVFGDGVATEMSAITGNTTDGFVLTHNIVVSA
jgi:protocatechuate 3,4-dioxygenase beta subunit